MQTKGGKMKFDLKDVKKEIENSVHEDGLIDLAWGFILFWIAIFIYREVMFDIENTFFMIYPAAFIGIILNTIRKKFVYPRTGFFKSKKDSLSLGKIFIVGGFVIVIFIGMLVFMANEKVIPAVKQLHYIIGFLISIVLLISAFVTKVKRYYIYAYISFASLLVIPFGPENKIIAALYFTFIISTSMMIGGLFTFIKFLRSNPILQDPIERDEMFTCKLFDEIKNDGILEVTSGIYFILFATSFLYSSLNAYVIQALVIAPLVAGLGQYIIRKKLNSNYKSVEIDPNFQFSILTYVSMSLLSLFGFIVKQIVFTNNMPEFGSKIFLIFMMLFSGITLMLTVRLKMKRFYIYSISAILIGIIGFFMKQKVIEIFMIFGIIMALLTLVNGTKRMKNLIGKRREYDQK